MFASRRPAGFEVNVLCIEDLLLIVVLGFVEAGVVGISAVFLPRLLERIKLGLELIPLLLGLAKLTEQPIVVGVGDFK